jgi:hypothetical protein|tara:strand:- start:500 stop:727 length:228 start_codon:yes stop_codon:yes gene_type:complete
LIWNEEGCRYVLREKKRREERTHAQADTKKDMYKKTLPAEKPFVLRTVKCNEDGKRNKYISRTHERRRKKKKKII